MSIERRGIQTPARSRRRNTVLSALETFRLIDPAVTLNSLVVFLYVAENEGLCVTELAQVSGLSKPTASRCVRSLAPPGSRWALPPALGLVEVCREGPSTNSKTLRLTVAGRALCARLERHIAEQRPIHAEPFVTHVVSGAEGQPPESCSAA